MYSLHRGTQAVANSTAACITSLHVAGKNNIGGFSLAVSTLTAKLPNLIPYQIFLAIQHYTQIMCGYTSIKP